MKELQNKLNHYIAIARPDHWVKHAFVLPGLFAALVLNPLPLPSSTIVYNSAAGLLSAFLIASANYVINEWLDAETDRNHPEKMYRPAALGLLRAKWVYFEYFTLTLSGLILANTVNFLFFVTIVAFFISGIVYNLKPLRVKDRVFLDVILESFNNPIRLLLGWAMVSNNTIPPLSLFLSYWAAGAFLMAAKRKSEYEFILQNGGIGSLEKYRKSFRYYSSETLIISCFVYAMVSSFGLAVFLIKYRAEMVFIFPILILLFTYYMHLTLQQNSIAQKPEKLHLDRKLMAVVLLLIASMVVLSLLDLPLVEKLVQSDFLDIDFVK